MQMIYSTKLDKRLFNTKETIVLNENEIFVDLLFHKTFEISNIIVFKQINVLYSIDHNGTCIDVVQANYDNLGQTSCIYVTITGTMYNDSFFDILKEYNVSVIIIDRDNMHNKADLLEFPLFCEKLSLACKRGKIKVYVKGLILNSFLEGKGINRSELTDASFIKKMNMEPIFVYDSKTKYDLFINTINLYSKIKI